VPGISRILGERPEKPGGDTYIGVASSDAAAASSPDDCNAVKPPSEKTGT